ncbi:MAG: radical SAM protein [Patescibacteria group bacterium]|nr:radical SAM protein [Patescibacteria group bacterium]
MKRNKDIPSLRIAATKDCNFNCYYCPLHGDSYECDNEKQLKKEDYLRIIEIAHSLGFDHFSVTGGEPLTVPEITFSIAKQISEFEDVKYLRLNTNGFFLDKYSDEIEQANFGKIKVSLDTLDSKKHSKITNQPHGIESIIRGIDKMIEKQIPVRLHTVVTKSNLEELDNIISFCEEKRY